MPSPDPQIAVLIVAAGRGLRANAGARADATPKQYRVLAGKPVLARTIESVLSLKAVGHVEVVIGAEDDEAFAALGLNDPRIHHTHGGATRQESVLAGLEALARRASPPDAVLVHDGARPFAPREVFEAVIAGLASPRRRGARSSRSPTRSRR